MEPLTIALAVGAGAQVVSGLMQYYQAEKARGATKRRLDEIERMFNQIVPPEYDLKVFDNPELANDIPAPAINLEAITPELYEQVGQFVPEIAEFVQEANPQLVQATEAARTGRQAQLEALEKYRQIASGGFDPELAQKLSMASQQSNIDAQSRADSILQDAQRRGQFGSGMMVASQQRAASDAMTRAALESQLAAAESYRNQLGALGQSANLGADIRQSEMSDEARNVGIINDFNERTSRNFQNYLTNRADTLNRAKVMELERARSVADANTRMQNEAAIRNRNMQNEGAKMRYDVARQQRGDKLDIIDRKNTLRQRMYDNAMADAAAKAGVQYNRVNEIQQNARDRNQMISGLGNAASAGAMYYGKYSQPRKTTSGEVITDARRWSDEDDTLYG